MSHGHSHDCARTSTVFCSRLTDRTIFAFLLLALLVSGPRLAVYYRAPPELKRQLSHAETSPLIPEQQPLKRKGRT